MHRSATLGGASLELNLVERSYGKSWEFMGSYEAFGLPRTSSFEFFSLGFAAWLAKNFFSLELARFACEELLITPYNSL